MFATCLLLAVSQNSYGGTFREYEFIGFSEDGRFLAFEQYAVEDGTGYAVSTVYIVEVEKNDWVVKPISYTDEKSNLTLARTTNAQRTKPLLEKYAIKRGNTGSLVVARLRTDLTKHPTSARFTKAIGSMYSDGDYELDLNQSPLKSDQCFRSEPPEAKLFELVLRNLYKRESNILQKDTQLPRNRGCVKGYRIEKVFVLKNKIAVFIDYQSEGYEGPDGSYLVVTGALN